MTNEQRWIRKFLMKHNYHWLCGTLEPSLFEKHMTELVDSVRDGEIEECAKVVEQEQVFDVETPGVKEFNGICKRLAHDIRSRKSKN